MIYAYIRVSSEKQHTEHQIHEVKTFAEQKGLNIDLVVQEKISGKVAIDHRELGKLRKKLKKNDMIIIEVDDGRLYAVIAARIADIEIV